MATDTVEFKCGTCNARRMHRFDDTTWNGHYVCTTCEARHTLGVDRGKMGAIPEVKETGVHRGPWAGYSVCAACKCGLHENRYYANNSVCPHCGAREGLDTIVRRPVFNRPARKQTWWEKLRGIPVKELPFKWDVKPAVTYEETDG